MSYTVERGDTLSAIARQHNMSLEELLKLNPDIDDPNMIRVGQVINTTPDDDDRSDSTADEKLKGTGEEDDPRFGVAGGAQLWKNATTGDIFIVYVVPGTEDDPVYMRWTVTEADAQSFFGPGKPVVYARTADDGDPIWADTIDFGSGDDIQNTSENPFASWASTMEVEAEAYPWILDDDYQRLLAMSVIEGRALTEAEIASTNWYQSHSASEREWMLVVNTSPAEAEQRRADAEDKVRAIAQQLGMSMPDEALVSFLANKWVTGSWTDMQVQTQIKQLADPYFEQQNLDPELADFIADNSIEFDTTGDMEMEVRRLVTQWLGTNFGDWDDASVAHWAGILRNETDGQERLTELLKDQRQALFPMYDREADWSSISSPWKTMIRNTWGTLPNDSDKMLHKIINMNDAARAGEYLTREGLSRGNQMVVASVQEEMNRAFGGTAR